MSSPTPKSFAIMLALATGLVLVASIVACSDVDRRPAAEPTPVAQQPTVDSSAVAIAVISLDPGGWSDIRAFLGDLPRPSAISIFYGNGNVLRGDNDRAVALLDSLAETRSLQKSDTPAPLPFFSTALSSAISESLKSPSTHTRTVVLGTFPPLALRDRSELARVGPIITKKQLDSLTALPDHRFIMIGPPESSILREMLLRAFTEAGSAVTSVSYQHGVAP